LYTDNRCVTSAATATAGRWQTSWFHALVHILPPQHAQAGEHTHGHTPDYGCQTRRYAATSLDAPGHVRTRTALAMIARKRLGSAVQPIKCPAGCSMLYIHGLPAQCAEHHQQTCMHACRQARYCLTSPTSVQKRCFC
jgi:hypothetical protein